MQRVDAPAPGDAVLAVGREDEVLLAQGPAGADLRRLLAEQLGPDAELAVALQCGRLDVDTPGQHHVAVEALDRLVVEVEGEVRVLDPLALGGQQLDQVGRAALRCSARIPLQGRGPGRMCSQVLLVVTMHGIAGIHRWRSGLTTVPIRSAECLIVTRARDAADDSRQSRTLVFRPTSAHAAQW